MSKGIRVGDDDPVFTLVALNEVTLQEVVDEYQHALNTKINTLISLLDTMYSSEKMDGVAKINGQVLFDYTNQLRGHLEAVSQKIIEDQKNYSRFETEKFSRAAYGTSQRIHKEIIDGFKAEFEWTSKRFGIAFEESLKKFNGIICEIENATTAITKAAEDRVKTAAGTAVKREETYENQIIKWILLSSVVGGACAALISVIVLKIMH